MSELMEQYGDVALAVIAATSFMAFLFALIGDGGSIGNLLKDWESSICAAIPAVVSHMQA